VSSLDATSLIGVAHTPGPPGRRPESETATRTEPTKPQPAMAGIAVICGVFFALAVITGHVPRGRRLIAATATGL
jgi:hypothetical protein